jgi:acyl carrier protein
MTEKSLLETVLRVIDEKANLLTPTQKLVVSADLCGVGLTPFSAIQLMLALENEFNVKFPERMLNRRSLSSINAICSCIRQLQEEQSPLKAA